MEAVSAYPQDEWTRISYAGYWDMPRLVRVEHDRRCLILYAPFQDELDDYAPCFAVFEVGRLVLADDAWFHSWERQILRKWRDIPCESAIFDKAHRYFIRRASLTESLRTARGSDERQ